MRSVFGVHSPVWIKGIVDPDTTITETELYLSGSLSKLYHLGCCIITSGVQTLSGFLNTCSVDT